MSDAKYTGGYAYVAQCHTQSAPTPSQPMAVIVNFVRGYPVQHLGQE